MTNNNSLRNDIVLSVNGALLGSVTPSLRAVAVDWNEEVIRIAFYFHGKILADDEETMSIVATEVATDFVDVLPVEANIERLDMPSPIKVHGVLVFKRQEPHPLLIR